MFNLSACAIFRNEAPYLAEWIEFHLLQGVEHFYLYDNNREPNLNDTAVLQPYIDLGLVTLTWWPGRARQRPAYTHCLETFGDTSVWIAFIDIDEFLWFPQTVYIPGYYTGELQSILNEFEKNVGVVAPHWVLHGSSGYTEKTNGLVTERFLQRARLPDKHVKSIVRPSLAIGVGNDPHTFRTRGKIVSEKKAELPIEYAINYGDRSADLLRISHFHTKSYGEYKARKGQSRDAGSGRAYTDAGIINSFRAHDLNEVEDKTLLKFVPQILANMESRK